MGPGSVNSSRSNYRGSPIIGRSGHRDASNRTTLHPRSVRFGASSTGRASAIGDSGVSPSEPISRPMRRLARVNSRINSDESGNGPRPESPRRGRYLVNSRFGVMAGRTPESNPGDTGPRSPPADPRHRGSQGPSRTGPNLVRDRKCRLARHLEYSRIAAESQSGGVRRATPPLAEPSPGGE